MKKGHKSSISTLQKLLSHNIDSITKEFQLCNIHCQYVELFTYFYYKKEIVRRDDSKNNVKYGTLCLKLWIFKRAFNLSSCHFKWCFNIYKYNVCRYTEH
jgi:hypothetical protein